MGQGKPVTDHPYPVGFYVPPMPPPSHGPSSGGGTGGTPEPTPTTPEPEPKPRDPRTGGPSYGKHGLAKDGMRTLFMDYDSVNDVLAHLEQDRSDDAGTSSDAGYKTSDQWDLGIGWEGALDAYTGGWAEGAQKAYELAERIKPYPIDKRTTFVRDVAGSFPNVGAYLAGAPNAMHRPSRKTAKSRPMVHLYAPIGYSGGVDANTAFDRGCAIVALCDALETAGCRVRITLTRNSWMTENTRLTWMTENTRLTMRFNVKGYGERLDIDQIMFTAAHPAMFRRICFGLQERSEHKTVKAQTTRGYGQPTGIVPGVDTEPDGSAVLVVLPRLAWAKGSAEEYLAEMVAALPEELQAEIRPPE